MCSLIANSNVKQNAQDFTAVFFLAFELVLILLYRVLHLEAKRRLLLFMPVDKQFQSYSQS